MSGKQKILIADDDTNIVELISLYLTKEGYETKKAYNGREALKHLQSFAPNLMILDIILQEDCSCCKEIYYKASKLDARNGWLCGLPGSSQDEFDSDNHADGKGRDL